MDFSKPDFTKPEFSPYLGHPPAPGGSYTALTPLGMMSPATGSEVSAASPGWGGYGAGAGIQPYRAQGYNVSRPNTTPTELR